MYFSFQEVTLEKEIINELQGIISLQAISEATGVGYEVSFFGSMAMFLLIFFFIYKILNNVITRLNTAVTRIAGEKVVRYVKLQIMEKAKELDLASFDMPEFYEKLENANREAGNRPIQVMSATFDVVSKLISLVSYVIVLVTAPNMWWTAPLMMLVSVPTAVVNFTYRRKTFNYIRRRSKDRRQMSYYSDLMVDKNLVKEIRMYDLADTFREEYRNVFARYYAGMRKLIVRENAWQIFLSILSSVVNCVFFGFIAQHADQFLDLLLQSGDAIAKIQTDIKRHLVVTASARVQTFAGVADSGGQFALDESVDILRGHIDVERTALEVSGNGGKTVLDLLTVLSADNTLRFEHSGVRHATQNIFLGHAAIKGNGGVKIVGFVVKRLLEASCPQFHGKFLPFVK